MAQNKYYFNNVFLYICKIYTNMAVAGLKNLCAPSKLYLGISFVFMILVLFQNYSNVNTYCLGSYTCNVSSTALIFIIKSTR